MKIEIDLPESHIVNAICSAVEAGIYYWVTSVEFTGPEGKTSGPWKGDHDMERYFRPLQQGEMVVRENHEEEQGTGAPDTVHRLDNEVFRNALTVMAEKVPNQFAALLADDSDAETGDVLVQLACFGEIKYG